MATTLKALEAVIELPNPQQEDNEGLEASIITHTSIDNTTRVYRRTGGYHRFVMTFNLHPSLAVKLKEFLRQNLGNWLILVDYRERRFHAVITTNPVEFVGHTRHRESVTLEFLGVRLPDEDEDEDEEES